MDMMMIMKILPSTAGQHNPWKCNHYKALFHNYREKNAVAKFHCFDLLRVWSYGFIYDQKSMSRVIDNIPVLVANPSMPVQSHKDSKSHA